MLKEPKIIPFWSVFSLEFDFGVRKGVKFLFGGTQRGPVLIWGYGHTKRLRTVDLAYSKLTSHFGNVFFSFQNSQNSMLSVTFDLNKVDVSTLAQ